MTIVVYNTNSVEIPFRARAFIKGEPTMQVWDQNCGDAVDTLCRVYGVNRKKVFTETTTNERLRHDAALEQLHG